MKKIDGEDQLYCCFKDYERRRSVMDWCFTKKITFASYMRAVGNSSYRRASDNICTLDMVVVRVIVLHYVIHNLGLVPGIVALIFSWISRQYYEHLFNPEIYMKSLLDKYDDNIPIQQNKPMRLIGVTNMMDNILIQQNKPLWLIAVTNMMVVIIGNHSHDHILNKSTMWFIDLVHMMVVIHLINNHQGTNGMGRRLWHRVALKSNIGAAAANLTNKGVEILAAVDSSLTGGVGTSAIHSLRLVLDSGASSHVVGDRSILQGYQELANPRTGTQPDGSTVRMIGVGTIQTEHFTITNVYHVEGLSMNLISVSQLYRQYGMGVWFLRGRCGIMLDDRTTAGGGVLENNGLYVLTNLHVPEGPTQ